MNPVNEETGESSTVDVDMKVEVAGESVDITAPAPEPFALPIGGLAAALLGGFMVSLFLAAGGQHAKAFRRALVGSCVCFFATPLLYGVNVVVPGAVGEYLGAFDLSSALRFGVGILPIVVTLEALRDEVRRLRKQAGLPQLDLPELAGLSPRPTGEAPDGD